jgi:hypothetical protein
VAHACAFCLKFNKDSPHRGVQIGAFEILAGKFLHKFPSFVNKALFFVLNQLGSLFLSSVCIANSFLGFCLLDFGFLGINLLFYQFLMHILI